MTKPTGKKIGRPKKHASTDETRSLVEQMAAFGITPEQIAGIFSAKFGVKMSERIIRRVYAKELANGLPKSIANVAGNLYRLATGNSAQAAQAAKFYLATRARWSTVQEVHLHGIPKAEDSYVSSMIDLKALTMEELRVLESIAERLERKKHSEVEATSRVEDAARSVSSLN